MRNSPYRSVALLGAITACVLSSVFAGLSMCGGSARDRKVAYLVALGVVIVAMSFPTPRFSPLWRRGLFIVCLAVLSLIVEATASAFYPGVPSSWSGFVRDFVFHLRTGSC